MGKFVHVVKIVITPAPLGLLRRYVGQPRGSLIHDIFLLVLLVILIGKKQGGVLVARGLPKAGRLVAVKVHGFRCLHVGLGPSPLLGRCCNGRKRPLRCLNVPHHRVAGRLKSLVALVAGSFGSTTLPPPPTALLPRFRGKDVSESRNVVRGCGVVVSQFVVGVLSIIRYEIAALGLVSLVRLVFLDLLVIEKISPVSIFGNVFPPPPKGPFGIFQHHPSSGRDSGTPKPDRLDFGVAGVLGSDAASVAVSVTVAAIEIGLNLR
mmetsp:Transcript_17031/g.39303  ORF Transcript_17031/g.39303 Transcript_17031/m.39303 type:complete len:264 (+) Transcript_17031:897-1688(+)